MKHTKNITYDRAMSVKINKADKGRKHDEYGNLFHQSHTKTTRANETVLFNECRSCKFLNKKTLVCVSSGDYIDTDELYKDYIDGFFTPEEYSEVLSSNSGENPLSYVETEDECYDWEPLNQRETVDLEPTKECVYVIQERDKIYDLKLDSCSDTDEDKLGWLIVKKISL